MACRICGRSSCTESFHSIEEQEKYEEDDNGNLVLKKKKKGKDVFIAGLGCVHREE